MIEEIVAKVYQTPLKIKTKVNKWLTKKDRMYAVGIRHHHHQPEEDVGTRVGYPLIEGGWGWGQKAIMQIFGARELWKFLYNTYCY